MAVTCNPQNWPQIYKGKTVIDELIQVAADSIGATREEMLGRCKEQRLARARQAVYLVAYEAGMKPYRIAKDFGGRDHKTVVYGVDVAQEICRRDPDFLRLVNALRARAPIKRKALPRLLPAVSEDMNEEVLYQAKMKRSSIMLLAAIQRARAAA